MSHQARLAELLLALDSAIKELQLVSDEQDGRFDRTLDKLLAARESARTHTPDLSKTKMHIATVHVVFNAEVGTGKAEDFISDLLTDNPEVLGWEYMKAGRQFLYPTPVEYWPLDETSRN